MKNYLRIFLLVSLSGLTPGLSFAQPLANGKSKFLGAGTNSSVWQSFDSYWNQVTPGNDGKWGSVEYAQGQYNWTGLDIIYNYAINKGIPFKEHCLVWGSQQPSWIGSLDSASQRAAVEKWIDTLGHRYPSVSFVDVVNEPFHAPPVYKNALGGDGATGWDWVITSFQWARQSCANGVKLLLNEYNILQDNTATTNYINLITLLKDRGLIDGIGIQGHYFEFRSPVGTTTYLYDVNTIKGNLNRLAGLGLPIYITEFDVSESVDANQLSQYQVYFPIFWDHPSVKGITLWGYIENDVWNSYPYTYLIRTNETERPALQWLRTFIAVGSIPAAPSLISPKNITDVPLKPTLVWRSSMFATSYRLQISTMNDFSSLERDSTCSDTTLTLAAPLTIVTDYFWRVSAISAAGQSAWSTPAFFVTGMVNAVGDGFAETPRVFELFQNYPNPFNPMTAMSYEVPVVSLVTLRIFDYLGREVAVLVDGVESAGTHTTIWDASAFPSGMYFCRLTANGLTQTKKLVLIR
ncbi:MAG: endo-1,4-beta-xylanase [Bacteroidota bacterium]